MRGSIGWMIASIFLAGAAAGPCLAGPAAGPASTDGKQQGCSAYQQRPDGSWEPVPCAPVATGSSAAESAVRRTRHASHGSRDERTDRP